MTIKRNLVSISNTFRTSQNTKMESNSCRIEKTGTVQTQSIVKHVIVGCIFIQKNMSIVLFGTFLCVYNLRQYYIMYYFVG